MQQTKIYINIDGTSYHYFDSIRIFQSISDHHQFEITYRLDYFSSEITNFFDDTKSLIGKEIVIEIETPDQKSGSVTNGKFFGLVTEICSTNSNHEMNGNVIHVRGYSPSILLEDGPNCNSFLDQDLKSVVRKVTTGYPQNQLKINNNPRGKFKPHYLVQYNESNFAFINRLASRFGEWFFYDGEELVFGQNSPKTSTLLYGVNLISFDLQTTLKPQKFNLRAHDYWQDKKLDIKAGETYTNPKGVAQFIAGESEEFYQKPYARHVAQPSLESDSNQTLREAAKLQKDGFIGNMVIMSGTSRNSSLKIGHVADIKGPKQNFGSYIITSISHNGSNDGDYYNHFEAVPFEMITPPDTNIQIMSFSGDQTAVVLDNNDPESMGRVKVQFPWASGATPWLRVLTPHAGDKKGFYFIPENGEEVLAGFEGGDVEKPYIKGTLYNGKAKSADWKTDKNDKKVICTRSGHTIEFDDTDGKEKITISDKEGDSIEYDTSKKTLTITAAEKLNLNAKEIHITGENKVNISGKEFTLNSDNETTINSSANMTISAKTLDVNGDKTAVKGKTVDISGDTFTNIKGGMLNLN